MVQVVANARRGQMDIVEPVLVLAGRTALGVLLATVFGVVGIGIAWAMFVFFGAVSHVTLLVLFMCGAGNRTRTGVHLFCCIGLAGFNLLQICRRLVCLLFWFVKS